MVDLIQESRMTVVKHSVVKYYKKYTAFNLYENEFKWLNILKDTGIVPKIITHSEGEYIIMEYYGPRLNKSNCPKNIDEQIENILKILQKHNCRHNDIKPTELLVRKGKLGLCDFGWAYELDKDNPKNWPGGLGGSFRDPGGSNDDYSIRKSLEYCTR